MFERINGVTYYFKWINGYDQRRRTVVCLHGFTGTSETFIFLKDSAGYNYLAVDLIGHGKTACFVPPSCYYMSSLTKDLTQLIQALGLAEFYLLGYSMGARIALSLAMDNPYGLKGLIMESGTPGIESSVMRQNRKKSDQLLASQLVKQPLEKFVDYWENLPLFSTQKKLDPQVRKQIRKERMSQTRFGLAMSLAYMGTGAQKNYWPSLSQLPATLYIAGELDQKFVQIGKKMKEAAPQITLEIVRGAGHCIHVEQPDKIKETVECWLNGREEK